MSWAWWYLTGAAQASEAVQQELVLHFYRVTLDIQYPSSAVSVVTSVDGHIPRHCTILLVRSQPQTYNRCHRGTCSRGDPKGCSAARMSA